MSLRKLKKKLKQDLTDQRVQKIRKFKIKTGYVVLLGALLAGALLFNQLAGREVSEPQHILTQGIKQESLGRIDEALLSYARVVDNYPETVEATEALYKTARIWHFDRQDPRQALVNYLLLERDHTNSLLINKSREAAAQIVKYDLRDDLQAVGYYQRLLDAGEGELDHYQYEIADSYFRLENYPQARIELEKMVEDYPDSSLVADALHRTAMILILENRPDDAEKVWLRLIELFPQGPYYNQASFSLARLLEERGELEEALEQYRQLENFPRPLLLQQKLNHLQQRIETRNEAN